MAYFSYCHEEHIVKTQKNILSPHRFILVRLDPKSKPIYMCITNKYNQSDAFAAEHRVICVSSISEIAVCYNLTKIINQKENN